MSVDAATVRRIAHLARIAVTDAEVPHLQGELNAMLAFVELLSEVDVEGVEPMTSVTPMEMKKRADVVTDGEIADEIRGLTRQLRAIGGDIDRVVRDINVGNTPEAATMRTTFVEFAEVLWEVESFYRSLCANARARHSPMAKVS